jgi:hypothetical protein
MPDITENPTPQIVGAIARQLSDEVSQAQIERVLAAWNAAREGDDVGTLRRDPASGAVAHRVNHDGVHLWRVSAPDGSQYNDLQPTLPWPTIG